MINLDSILVTGGRGMIGRSIPFGLKPSSKECDVTQPNEVEKWCDKNKPSGIICLSSLDIRKSESFPIEAYRVNVLGTNTLAQIAQTRDIPFIFISSGAVFNGELNSSFDEQSLPNPINVYGHTKYLAEKLIQDRLKKYLIIRSGWLFGPVGAHHINFVERIKQHIETKKNIKATFDQQGCPTSVFDLIKKMTELLQNSEWGLYHVVNEGYATPYEIAQEVGRILEKPIDLVRCGSKDLQDSDPPRSPSEILKSKKLKMRNWKDALKEYLTSG